MTIPPDPPERDEVLEEYDPADPADRIERKVVASSGVTLLASLGFALANGYATTDGVLAPLPLWAQFPILLILPPLATYLAGYRTTSNRVP